MDSDEVLSVQSILKLACDDAGFIDVDALLRILTQLSSVHGILQADEASALISRVQRTPDGQIRLTDFLKSIYEPARLPDADAAAFLEAAHTGNMDALLYLLRCGAPLETRGADGSTALLIAAKAGHEFCLKMLAEAKADLEARDNKGSTAAILAAFRGQTACLRLLAELDVDLNACANDRSTAVGLAARCGRRACLGLLTERCANLEVKQQDGSTPALFAALGGNVACLSHLIACGVELEERNKAGFTPALLAAKFGHIGCLRCLVDHAADVLARDKAGRNAAMLAARNGHHACLAFLLEQGLGRTMNLKDGTPDVAMEFLLGKGELVILPDADDDLPRKTNFLTILQRAPTGALGYGESEPELEQCEEVLEAAAEGDLDRLKALAEAGKNLEGRSGSGATAAILASRGGNAACIQLLAKLQADLSATDTKGVTAIVAAARAGHVACLHLLTELSAPMEQSDVHGHTPLITAARCGHVHAVQALLELRAELEAKRNDGTSSLMDSAAEGHEACLHTLLSARAQHDIRDNRGSTALSLASAKGHEHCARLLVAKGADLLEKDGRGILPVQSLEKHCPSLLDSLLPRVDWCSAAKAGPFGLIQQLFPVGSSMQQQHFAAASLHLALWRGPAQVRDTCLARLLGGVVRELLSKAGQQCLDMEQERALLSSLLNLGVLASDGDREPTEAVVDDALNKLQAACDERQQCLHSIATMTEHVDSLFSHSTRWGEQRICALDQRDAMPETLWTWAETHHSDCFHALYSAFQAFFHAGAVQSPGEFARLLRDARLTSDDALFASGASDLLMAYARQINPHFVDLMHEQFGAAFTEAPIKRKPRMVEKIEADLRDSLQGFPGFDSAGAAGFLDARCAFFTLCDIVRGSVTADGAEEMLEVIRRLHNLEPRFAVWRVKNSHHADATTLGGYRDVKVLGRLQAPGGLAMVVEVQVLDSRFLALKKYMHKVYAVKRGDFWAY
eukprot:TRINITY_DN59082_c0_g1_i1.p1 TRINITY_DN59082_c0_g1~~TRINITY_DN59082_c0_g1_i1.p1  ORF type:complete len:970 (+),score=194.74 TRINITY_DN59082_c0_g1_i1:137-3046(+)